MHTLCQCLHCAEDSPQKWCQASHCAGNCWLLAAGWIQVCAQCTATAGAPNANQCHTTTIIIMQDGLITANDDHRRQPQQSSSWCAAEAAVAAALAAAANDDDESPSNEPPPTSSVYCVSALLVASWCVEELTPVLLFICHLALRKDPVFRGSLKWEGEHCALSVWADSLFVIIIINVIKSMQRVVVATVFHLLINCRFGGELVIVKTKRGVSSSHWAGCRRMTSNCCVSWCLWNWWPMVDRREDR